MKIDIREILDKGAEKRKDWLKAGVEKESESSAAMADGKGDGTAAEAEDRGHQEAESQQAEQKPQRTSELEGQSEAVKAPSAATKTGSQQEPAERPQQETAAENPAKEDSPTAEKTAAEEDTAVAGQFPAEASDDPKQEKSAEAVKDRAQSQSRPEEDDVAGRTAPAEAGADAETIEKVETTEGSRKAGSKVTSGQAPEQAGADAETIEKAETTEGSRKAGSKVTSGQAPEQAGADAETIEKAETTKGSRKAGSKAASGQAPAEAGAEKESESSAAMADGKGDGTDAEAEDRGHREAESQQAEQKPQRTSEPEGQSEAAKALPAATKTGSRQEPAESPSPQQEAAAENPAKEDSPAAEKPAAEEDAAAAEKSPEEASGGFSWKLCCRQYGWVAAIAASFVLLLAAAFAYIDWLPKEVSAVINGEEYQFSSTERTVEDFLEAEQIEYCQEDYISVSPEAFLYDGIHFDLTHAFDFEVTADGETKAYKSLKKTVGEALQEENITVGELDIVKPGVDTPLKDEMSIVLQRVVIRKETVEEKVPYKTVEKDDSSMDEGTSKVVKKGKNGTDAVTYRIKYVDGKVVSKKEIARKTITAKVDKVVANGTRINIDGISYSRKLVVKAYAYTGGGTTAMGTAARVGEIAVDPGVIPLGSTVYIEGVGVRRAEDTGGNIQGNTIDIYMNSQSECLRWGMRYVTIYIQ